MRGERLMPPYLRLLLRCMATVGPLVVVIVVALCLLLAALDLFGVVEVDVRLRW